MKKSAVVLAVLLTSAFVKAQVTQTFTYTGTGGAGPFTVKISDPTTHVILPNEFFNLTIADSSGAGTFVRTADVNVAGDLLVSGGTFDISILKISNGIFEAVSVFCRFVEIHFSPSTPSIISERFSFFTSA